jgi:hypothetical protein
MVLLAEGVVEVCCEPSLISLTARGRKVLLAIGLKLQHHGLGIIAGSDVDIHDLERQLIDTAIVHRRVEVGQRHKRPVSILCVEIHLCFNDNARSFRGQLQQDHIQVTVGNTGEHCARRDEAVIDSKDWSKTVVDADECGFQLATEPLPH